LLASWFDVNANDTIKLINASGDSAIVSLYGAQVLSWRTASGDEHPHCSPQTDNAGGRAIRGGVPICFPQFGNYGSLTKHGFARTSVWQSADDIFSGSYHAVANAQLSMQDSEFTREVWPYKFLLILSVSLGFSWIEILLTVTNTGDEVFDFTAALHSYFAAADVRLAAICGLEGVPYLDALYSNIRIKSPESPLLVSSETDRVYLGVTKLLKITYNRRTSLQVEQQGFSDTVVWNPGPIKAAALGDMPPSDWTRMLCIEAAQVEHPVKLQPKLSWHGLQRIKVCFLSNFSVCGGA
jgi:glucose-6-phosphate 1-epimerase